MFTDRPDHAQAFNLGEDAYVVELPELDATGTAYELHLVALGPRVIAWWETDRGVWLGVAYHAEA